MNKKTKINLMMFFGLLFVLVGLGLGVYEVYIIFSVMVIKMLSYILLAVAAVALIVGIVLLVVAKKISKDICLKCGCDLDGCAYEWVLESMQDNISQSSIDGDYYSTESIKYVITATCPKCEKQRVFYKEFTSADYRTRTYRNPNKQIEDWCKNKFGH